MQIDYKASDEIRAAIAELGRTEDVQFSPDNRRLAIAGMNEKKILVLDIWIERVDGRMSVEMTDCTIVTSPSLTHPHGLFWIDDATIVAANRDGEAPILKVPRGNLTPRRLEPAVVRLLRADGTDLLASPGSVSVRNIGAGIHEALFCNNWQNYVSRHLLDERSGFRAISSEILLSDGLDIPDGVVHSPSGRWLAVSNHNDRSVFIYDNEARLDRQTRPVGTLRGMDYPHGIRFTPDERHLLVADAGAPFVHFYGTPDGDWRGPHQPLISLQVIDGESFRRGHSNPQEGGPKGIDINRDATVLVASCEEQPIVFFDIRDTLAATDTAFASNGNEPRDTAADRARELLLARLSSATAELGALRADLARAGRDKDEALQRAAAAQQALAAQAAAAEQTRLAHQEAEQAFGRALGAHEEGRLAAARELARVRAFAHKARAEARKWRSEAGAVRRSTSWRITAPLRALVRLPAGQATGSEAEARENLSMISDAEMQARLETVRAYPVAWLKKGPAYVPPEIRPDEQAAIVWEHGRRNMELRAAGRMAIVGPLQGAGEIVGMCIFCVPEAEAREIMEGDGAVRAEIFTYEIVTLYGIPGQALPA